ncbi:WbqC family protein [Aminobacter sp. UC22_36]|uniref:WbqC family protein n=1 Tax=Aminobacter sp. UC22_36 TaxID=3374549 RepID=UPI003757C219
MSRTVVITQSNYIPWRGYFDMLRLADQVVLLDSVQYTRRDWRNRNKIKTPQGASWLSISVEVKGRYNESIDQIRIADMTWAQNHRRAISLAYRRAPHFGAQGQWVDDLLARVAYETRLTDVNETLIRAICEKLKIGTSICRCTDLLSLETMAGMDPSERLAALAERAGATRYISGPAAKAYLDHEAFNKRGIEVGWMDYSGYPPYPQLWGDFEPAVSILDLILNTGDDATHYLEKTIS